METPDFKDKEGIFDAINQKKKNSLTGLFQSCSVVRKQEWFKISNILREKRCKNFIPSKIVILSLNKTGFFPTKSFLIYWKPYFTEPKDSWKFVAKD